MGIWFEAKFKELGAECLLPSGVADADKHTTEQDFETWRSDLWSKLFAYYKSKQPTGTASTGVKTRSMTININIDPSIMPYKVVSEESTDSNVLTPSNCIDKEVKFDMNAKHYMKSFDCKVSTLKELRQKSGDAGSTIECIFEMPEGVSYKTAANSAIFAPNQPSYISKFIESHKLKLEDKFKIAKNRDFSGHTGNLSVPIISKSITVKEFLTNFLDL